MSKNISNAMKKFWSNKSEDEMKIINVARSISASKCIYIKKDEISRAEACNINVLLIKLAEGYKICNTSKNIDKIKNMNLIIPNEYFI